MEIEAKLLARDAMALRGLGKALEELCDSVRPLGRRLIEDTYFDTAEWDLLRAGYACRLRREGGRAVLAMKSLTPPRHGITRREEVEEVLALPLPRSARPIPGRCAGRGIREITGEKPLRRLFRNRNRRTLFEVQFGQRLVAEVCADDFTLIAGGRRRRLAEVEIEVKAGGVAELRRFARLLARRLRLSTAHRAKFQQGLDLAGLRPPMHRSR
jgi:inorganic triphosphatase YgiF